MKTNKKILVVGFLLSICMNLNSNFSAQAYKDYKKERFNPDYNYDSRNVYYKKTNSGSYNTVKTEQARKEAKYKRCLKNKESNCMAILRH